MDKETAKAYKSLGHLSTVGLVMALCVTIGSLVGIYLDKKFGTDPWLLLVFFCFGVIAAFKNLFVMIKRFQKQNDQEK